MSHLVMHKNNIYVPYEKESSLRDYLRDLRRRYAKATLPIVNIPKEYLTYPTIEFTNGISISFSVLPPPPNNFTSFVLEPVMRAVISAQMGLHVMFKNPILRDPMRKNAPKITTEMEKLLDIWLSPFIFKGYSHAPSKLMVDDLMLLAKAYEDIFFISIPKYTNKLFLFNEECYRDFTNGEMQHLTAFMRKGVR